MAMTKPLNGFRLVAIHYNDTLQRIAQREMGDTTRWSDLIAINDLLPPYLTGDPEEAGDHVKLYGQFLMVPATEAQTDTDPDPERLYGADLVLRRGLLEAGPTGDLALVSGVPNLRQSMENALSTPPGDLLFHPRYGCEVHALKGEAAQPGIATLGAQFVRSTLLADSRVQDVPEASATFRGDALRIEATVQPVTGSTIGIKAAG